MVRNYRKGVVGYAINVMLTAAAMNFKQIMNIFKRKMAFLFRFFQDLFFSACTFFYPQKLKITF